MFQNKSIGNLPTRKYQSPNTSFPWPLNKICHSTYLILLSWIKEFVHIISSTHFLIDIFCKALNYCKYLKLKIEFHLLNLCQFPDWKQSTNHSLIVSIHLPLNLQIILILYLVEGILKEYLYKFFTYFKGNFVVKIFRGSF